MSSVDDRVVAMKFDNAQFEKGVSQTSGSLDKLKKSLDFGNSKKGMDDLQASASKFSLGGMAGAVEGISTKFLALSTVAITALSNITNRAVDAGINVAKSFTLDPIIAGFQEYELKMGSIQTILANTARHGTELPQVTASLDELNEYADKTIYNFGEMTKNIGLFTNAGIKVEDATSMIKGFSNMAAASGTSAQGAAGAAYQLSQALSTGTIRLMDWRSLTNVGMGNKNMQDGIIEIADAMGELDKAGISATSVQDDFNGSLEKNWLSADVMSSYLKIMAGEMTEAEQAALGLSDAQIKAFAEQQATAQDAATKVRTFTQLVDTLKEGVGSSWSETMDILIGDFDQATDLWSGVSDTLGKVIGDFGDRRNEMLKGWADLGGRDAAVQIFTNAWRVLGEVITPIREAFREIFPAKTSQDLYNMTIAIRDFMANLKMGGETAENLKRTFKGVFAIFSIGWQILKGIGSVFAKLFGQLGKGSGGFLNLTGNIGDFLVSIDAALKQGGALSDFFGKVGDILSIPIQLFQKLAGVVGGLFSGMGGFSADGIGAIFGSLGDYIDDAAAIGQNFDDIWDKMAQTVSNAWNSIKPFFDKIGEAFSGIGDKISGVFSSDNFDPAMDLLQTGFLGGIFLLIKKFFSNGLSLDFGGGMLEGIKDAFEGLTGYLTAMQANVQADTLMKIAIAVGVLTASVVVLSLIDTAALAKSLGAMTVAFGQLLGAMAILTKIAGVAGIAKIPVIAASMILLSTAILILTFAVRSLSGLAWDELLKGLLGVGILLGMVVLAAKGLSGVSGQMMRAGAGMILIALALKVLASAVKDFADISWSEMLRGMTGLAVALGVIIAGMQLMPKGMIAQGLGLLAVAAALKVIASAVTEFASMSWTEVAKGLRTMALALATIAAAMHLMPKNMFAQALGLLAVSGALLIISKAISSMGGMSWEEVAKGLVALAGSLGILAGGMKLMSMAKGGALALAAASAALALFVPVLITLGSLSWGTIVTGLVALAATFAVLGVAGMLLGPIAPALMSIALSLLAVGAAFVLFGVGAMALAKAFEIIAKAGDAGVQAIIGILEAVISAIPALIASIGEGIVAFLGVIAASGPAIVDAFVAILTSLLDAVIQLVPKIAETFGTVLMAIITTTLQYTPVIIQTGFDLLMSFLQGIANNIGQVINTAVDIIVNFINGIASNIGKIIQAGFDLAISFLNGVADGIKNNSGAVVQAALNIGSALVQGLWDGITGLADWLWDQVSGWISGIWDGIMDFFGIESPSKEMAWAGEMLMLGLGGGIDKNGHIPVEAGKQMSEDVMAAMTDSLSKVPSLLDGVTDMEPVIAPVLDLSMVRNEASKISDILAADALSSDVTLGRAQSIAQDVSAAMDEKATATAPIVQEIKFEQINNSPKALSPVEIYRNTRNQISMAKEALTA